MINLLVGFLSLLNVMVDSPNFTTETVPKVPGTYPIVVSYEGPEGSVSKVVMTTIGSENFISYEDIAIDANDIYTTKEQQLNSEFLISGSKVKVWNLTTGEEYFVDEIGVVEVDEKTYRVTFESFEKISITITVYIIDQDTLYKGYVTEDSFFTKLSIDENYLEFFILIISFVIFIILLILYAKNQIEIRKQLSNIIDIY